MTRSSSAKYVTPCVLVLAAACTPHSGDHNGNASNPNDAGSVARLAQDTTSVVYVVSPDAGPGVITIGFQDYAGAYVESPPDSGHFVPAPGVPSSMGLATSTDLGQTWTRQAPLTPVALACSGAQRPGCVTQVLGTPSLANGGVGTPAIYTTLATTLSPDGVSTSSDTVVTSTSVDGIHWGDLVEVMSTPGKPLLSPTASMSGDIALVVAAYGYGTATSGIYLADSDTGAATWGAPVSVVPFLTEDPSLSRRRPIIRAADLNLAYLAYIEDAGRTTGTGQDSINIKIARLQRIITSAGPGMTETFQPWETTELIFNVGPIDIDTVVGGGQGRQWYDLDPIGFDVGTKDNHLYLSYKQVLTSPDGAADRLVFWDCVDSVLLGRTGGCFLDSKSGTTASPPWHGRLLDASVPKGAVQPSVAAYALSDTVAVTWFSRASSDPPGESQGNYQLTPVGVYSVDGGMTFASIVDFSSAWSPCPTPPPPSNPSLAGFFGDYVGSTILPFSLGQIASSAPLPPSAPAIITAYASSNGGCLALGQATEDQHIQAITW